ncbi:glycosyltransferase family 4 protein [Ralstonia mannitolilytica]|uniref:glycosyltransferase family 4 protein n=1 Tax=Ralstonia mannitolilytica TaxID=105219 RepID=UPI0028F50E7C|nr:glycosyltransferase family 4 protein [Ralstonia mannitolilytica]CAJ0894406.1 hypothetical protein R76727_04522 [Ralstonia mannitolilytica]
MLKVLALTKYGRLGASSRLRFFQYFPWLEGAGMKIVEHTLLSDQMLQRRYASGRYEPMSLLHAYFERCLKLMRRHQFDLIWIEKEALQWTPLWLERGLLRGIPYVLDYDDAVFHNYDQHANRWVRRLYGHRLDGLMAQAALVVVGNDYLAQRARDAGAKKVEVVPTVIDLERYRTNATPVKSSVPRIVWIGSPSTTRYLNLVAKPLRELITRQPFVLRVIGGEGTSLPDIPIEELSWSEASEVAMIQESDIGIMPLEDSVWERGKCGYKLIQYMACGLPVVASDVGVNSQIVMQGKNGYLAQAAADWIAALETLLMDRALRSRMGLAGRQRVEDLYCVQRTGDRMAQLLADSCRVSKQSNHPASTV